MSSFLVGGANAAGFMLCAAFLTYVLAIVIPLARHRRGSPGDPSGFEWHFLIPCLNEERIIAATVADLFRKFPAAHIWCIDDASTDSTPHILARLASRSRQVHVVTRRAPDAQQGKGPALNAGWKALSDYLPPGTDPERVLVGIIDADGILDRRCPALVTGPGFFGDPRVGAVQIRVRVVNQAGAALSARTRWLIQMQDIEFSCIMAGMQLLRRHVGSTAMGGNGQFTRLSTLQQVTHTFGTPWEKALVEDFELGLRILLTGGKTEYCHDTWVAQQGPPTVGRLMRQRSRWAQGLMQCSRYFLPVMRCPKISTPAAMEIGLLLLLPWFQLFGVVVYFIFMGVLVLSALAAQGGPIQWFGAGNWGLLPLFALFGLIPLAMWGPIYRHTVARELSLTRAVLLGLANWPYTYIHHVSTWWALGRVLRSRHDWKKTERLDLPGQPIATRLVPAAIRMPSTRTRPSGRAARAPLDIPVAPPHSIVGGPSRAPLRRLPAPAPRAALPPGRGALGGPLQPPAMAATIAPPLMAAGKLRVSHPEGGAAGRAGRRYGARTGHPLSAPVVGGRLRLDPPGAVLAAAGRDDAHPPA